MAEQITPHVARHFHESLDRNPTRESPKQIIGGDQRDQQSESKPHRSCCCGARGERVYQELDTVLRPNRAGNGRKNSEEDSRMGDGTTPQIAKKECDGAMRKVTEIRHDGL